MIITPPILGKTDPPEFVAYEETMLREPRLLVPGMQPLGPVKVDWRNPITKGLSFCTLGPCQRDLAQNRGYSLYNSITQKIGIPGCSVKGAYLAANAGVKFPLAPNEASNVEMTFVCQFLEEAWDNGIAMLMLVGDEEAGSGYAQRTLNLLYSGAWVLDLDTYPGGLNLTSNALPGFDYNKVTVGGVSVSNGGSTHSAFADGKNIGVSASTTKTTGNTVVSGPAVQGSPTGGLARSGYGQVFFAAHWTRGLSDAEMASITADPYSILIPA